MAEEIFLESFKEEAKDYLETAGKRACFGCRHDCPGQRDHDCLMDEDLLEQLLIQLLDLVPKIDVWDKFATKCKNADICIRQAVLFLASEPFAQAKHNNFFRQRMIEKVLCTE